MTQVDHTEGSTTTDPKAPAVVPPGRFTPGRRGSVVRGVVERYALVGILAVVVLFFSVYSKSSSTFPTTANLSFLTADQMVTVTVALAAMFPLIAGCFDFSVGANSVLSSVLIAGFESRLGWPTWLTIVVPLLISTLIGVINGSLVAYFEMQPFVTTLGSFTLLGGVVQWYTHGQSITTGISQGVLNFGADTFLGLSDIVYLVLVMVIACWYLLNHTPYGRTLYSIGSSSKSARLVGIRVPRTIFTTYAFSGFLAGLGGLLIVAHTGAGTDTDGGAVLFGSLAAVFLGATAIRPGHFNVIGTLIGVALVAVAVSGLTLAGTSDWVSPVFNGSALLIAVGLSTYLRITRVGRSVN